MANIQAQATSANTTLTYAAASAGGDVVVLGSAQRATLLVRNGGTAPITATFAAVSACSQGFLHNTVVTCAVGDTEVAVPQVAITPTGTASVTYSAATSVTVAAVTN